MTIDSITQLPNPQGFSPDPLTDILAPGYLTTIRDSTGTLQGLLHCRCGVTIDRLAVSEEWLSTNMLCSTLEPTHSSREQLFEKLRFHFELSPKHQVCSIGAQILHPSLRGGEVFRAMMRDIARTISPKHARLPLLCELSEEGSTARTLNEAVMDRVVYDVLPPENGHCMGYSSRTSNALYYYEADQRHWSHAVREQRLKEKRMFFPHPEDHPNVEVRETNDGRGLGVFATGAGIKKGDIVARFDGERYKSPKASQLGPVMVDKAIQVGEHEFVFARHSLAQLINSSHSPNLGLSGDRTLVALVDIPSGSQAFWMYEMSECSDWRCDVCLCGSDECPGYIGSFSDLAENKQRELIRAGDASDWIIEKYG